MTAFRFHKIPLLRRSALLMVAALVVVSCNGGEKAATGNAVAARTSFATWDDAVPQTGPSGQQVVFVGIDGAAWWYVDQLIDEGRLPNLARVEREGAWGTLRSLPSFVSPPAWTSMMTGYLPARSGIYTFGKWDRQKREFSAVRSDDVKVPFVWDAASRVGRRVAVVNVPVTWPVHEVNGVMVSGLLTPIDLTRELNVRYARHNRQDDFVVAPVPHNVGVGHAALEDTLNLFLFSLYDTSDDNVSRPDSVTLRVLSKYPGDAASPELGHYRFATNEFSPWVRVRHDTDDGMKLAFTKVSCDVDREGFDIAFGVNLFPIASQYTYPESLATELERRFDYYLPSKYLTPEMLPSTTRDAAGYMSYFYDRDDWDLFVFVFTQSDNAHHQVGFDETAAAVYERIDRAVGDLMAKMPSNATLVIASDHGFDHFRYGVDLNRVLANIGLLEWRAKGEVDFDRTLVFHNLYHLYFNRDLITRGELAARGIDVPEGADPVAFLVDYVVEHASRVPAPRLGRELTLEFDRVPPGDLVGDAPLLIVKGSYDDYIVEFWNLTKPRDDVVFDLGPQNAWHRRDGMFMMWGGGVSPGEVAARDIQDIAPTMAFLLGIPVGPDVDGQVIFDALTPQLISSRPVYVVDAYRSLDRTFAETPADREELEKKLRSLGYVQ